MVLIQNAVTAQLFKIFPVLSETRVTKNNTSINIRVSHFSKFHFFLSYLSAIQFKHDSIL